MLPGPVIMSTGASSVPSVSVPPYASSATACAPPTAHTSVTPSSAAAARIVGCGRPLKGPAFPACGGLAITSESTPAVCAGTTFITTLDGYTALPPGTYSPTRSTGTQRSVTVAPGANVVVVSVRRWSACTARARSIATSSAARTSESSSVSAAVNRSAGTRT